MLHNGIVDITEAQWNPQCDVATYTRMSDCLEGPVDTLSSGDREAIKRRINKSVSSTMGQEEEVANIWRSVIEAPTVEGFASAVYQSRRNDLV